MDGKAERRWLGTSPCDNERAITLRKNALRACEGKSSELIPPGPRSRVGTRGYLPVFATLNPRARSTNHGQGTHWHQVFTRASYVPRNREQEKRPRGRRARNDDVQTKFILYIAIYSRHRTYGASMFRDCPHLQWIPLCCG